MSIEASSDPRGASVSSLPRTAARYVGIDVGGTKTHVVAEDTDGRIIDLIVPSAQWRTGDLFDHDDNFRRLADLLTEFAEIDSTTTIAAGIHDCDSDEQMAQATEHLTQHLAGHATVVNDAQLLRYLTTEHDTIEMIVGTGAIVSGRTEDGTRLTVDGHGWPMGDRGSAADLVHSALRSTLQASDQPQPSADPLHGQIMAAFGAADGAELAVRARTDASDRSWAQHAPVIFTAWDAGSTEAEQIILHAAHTLARYVGQVVARGAVGSTVIAGGGVITAQPRYQDAVREALTHEAPGLTLTVASAPPAHGALELARRLG